MTPHHVSRRGVLRGIAGAGVGLTFVGYASASDGRAQYIVVGRGGGVRRELERDGFTVQHELAGGTVFVLRGPTGAEEELQRVRGVDEAARDVRFELEEPELEAVPDDLEPDSEHTATDLYPLMWDKQVTDVLAAHDYATGVDTRLAILDTGIDPDHPDLAENVDEDLSRLFTSGDPIDDHPWDAHGHGTHVAGTAAARSDAGAPVSSEETGEATGIVGTAPEAELVSAKVFWFEDPEGHEDEDEPFLTTTTADILRAIDYSAEIGADAANMSLGTPPLPPQVNAAGIRVAYERVIQDATRRGTVVVASAGNSDANLQQGGFFTVPNSTAGSMSISATGPNDLRTFYSNYGTNEIDVGAPGGGYETLEKTLAEDTEWPYPTNLVFSTVPPQVYGVPYAYFAGTSMASPQVTGLVGLVRQLHPNSNANQVEQVIKHGAELVNGQSDPDLGAGRINALNTVELLDDGDSGGSNGNGNGRGR